MAKKKQVSEQDRLVGFLDLQLNANPKKKGKKPSDGYKAYADILDSI